MYTHTNLFIHIYVYVYICIDYKVLPLLDLFYSRARYPAQSLLAEKQTSQALSPNWRQRPYLGLLEQEQRS